VRYRSVFENTGTATIIIEEDMTISMANSRFEQLSGYLREEIEGKKKWTEFVVAEDLERMKAYHVKRRKDEESAPTEYEFGFIDKQGDKKNIFCKIGMLLGTKISVASLMDITARKNAEDALQESEQRFRELIENSLIGIGIIQDGRVIYRNPEQQSLLGPPSPSTNPFNFENIHAEDVNKVKELYQHLISGRVQTFQTDFRFYSPGRKNIANPNWF
jgi:PAS domain S-box-containing protein